MCSTDRPINAADQVARPRRSRSAVLRHVRDNGPRSHAHLAVLKRGFSPTAGVPKAASAVVETPGGVR